MNSDLRGFWVAFVSVVAVLAGCTERLPIDPIYSDDTDWTPSISLSKNDYHRLEIYIDRPPRKELLRNIIWYEFQFRRNASEEYQSFDSLAGFSLSPSYVYLGSYFPASHYPFPFRTKPAFEYNANYMVRMVTHYRPGNWCVSNELSFKTPIGLGKVLKRLPIPPAVASDDFPGVSSFCFHNGSMIVLRGRYLLQVDTSTGLATPLKRDFFGQGAFFNFLAITGDSIFTYSSIGNRNEYTLESLDLNSLKVDSSKKFSLQDGWLMQMFGFGSTVFTFWQLSNTQGFAILDTHTGQVREFSHEVGSGMYFPDVCTDGTAIWGQTIDLFDNRIVRIDPNSREILEVQRNPVFSPGRMSWDGKNFWVVDQETQTIAKLELQGF